MRELGSNSLLQEERVMNITVSQIVVWLIVGALAFCQPRHRFGGGINRGIYLQGVQH